MTTDVEKMIFRDNVYVYENPSIGANIVKIGRTSKDVKTRLAGAKTHSPEDPKLLLVYSLREGHAVDMSLEKSLHDYYEKYHYNREWYALPFTEIMKLSADIVQDIPLMSSYRLTYVDPELKKAWDSLEQMYFRKSQDILKKEYNHYLDTPVGFTFPPDNEGFNIVVHVDSMTMYQAWYIGAFTEKMVYEKTHPLDFVELYHVIARQQEIYESGEESLKT